MGSRRLSSELGDLVESVNDERGHGFGFDYAYGAPGHPQNVYCCSDHAMYARHGIPVTDEPQYVDYGKMSRVGRLIADVAGASPTSTTAWSWTGRSPTPTLRTSSEAGPPGDPFGTGPDPPSQVGPPPRSACALELGVPAADGV